MEPPAQPGVFYYNKNSLRNILINRRYLGIYIYQNKEVPGGMPRIIDDETFAKAQEVRAQNKKAPARAKAVEDTYLLTTKLYCGDCGSAMTGVSGTSHSGVFHQYYHCVASRRKRGCKKKAIRKYYLEDAVIQKTLSFLTPETLDMLAHAIEKQCDKDRNTDDLKRIKKLIRENENAIANLIKALEEGKAVGLISDQIEKREKEKVRLEAQFALEKIQHPSLKHDQVRFFFERFLKGDPSDKRYRQALVDIFVGRIELFEDHIVIYYNAHDGNKKIAPIDESEKIRIWGDVVEANRAGILPCQDGASEQAANVENIGTDWLPVMRREHLDRIGESIYVGKAVLKTIWQAGH